MLYNINGHALWVLGRLARTTADVIGGGQRSGDVVDDKLSESHHHGGQLVVRDMDIGKKIHRKHSGVWELSAVVGNPRGTDAICVVGRKEASVASE